jgi:hypothetical protein
MTQNVIPTIVRLMIMISVLVLGVLPESNMLHETKLEPDRIFFVYGSVLLLIQIVTRTLQIKLRQRNEPLCSAQNTIKK